MVGERHGEWSRGAGGCRQRVAAWNPGPVTGAFARPWTARELISPLARRFDTGLGTLARRLAVLLAVLALGLIADTALAASVDEGKTLFDAQCASCHTIGGGDGVGPDLKGVVAARGADWVHRFILNPQEVVDSGDPAAKELVDKFGVVMPTLGLDAAQVDSVVAFLEAEGGGAPAETQPAETQAAGTAPAETAPAETAPAEAPPAGAGDAETGKLLFTGSENLANGGPACMSCHSIAGIGSLGGGAVGPDLTGAAALYGAGLPAVIQSAAFPTMQPLFANHPIKPQEAADLAAFVTTAPEAERSSGSVGKLLLLGFGGAMALLAVGLLIWRKRLTGVRRPLVHGFRHGGK